MTEPDLIRFVNVQAQVYSRVVEELTDGRKRTHWIWFIFPQLAGLGHSATAQRYAIRDLEQARRYLADPLLGDRLRNDVRLLIRHKDKSALEILGSPNDQVSVLSDAVSATSFRSFGWSWHRPD